MRRRAASRRTFERRRCHAISSNAQSLASRSTTSRTTGRRSVAVLAEMPEVRWIRSYVSDVDGKIYCEYDAPSVEAIREHARRAGLPVDRVSEIALEINPAMFV